MASKVEETSSAEEEGMTVRLLYSKADSKVLFMEVGKDFVALLLSIMSLPFASIIKLFHENKAAPLKGGSMNKLFNSLEELRENGSPTPWSTIKLHQSSPSSISLLRQNDRLDCVYRCASLSCDLESVAMYPHAICPKCNDAMTTPIQLLSEIEKFYCCKSCGNGSSISRSFNASCPQGPFHRMNKEISVVRNADPFVPTAPSRYLAKNRHRFLVTNDLLVMASSAIDGMMLLSTAERSGEMGQVEIDLTPPQVLEFLRASLTSTTVLNDLFTRVIVGLS